MLSLSSFEVTGYLLSAEDSQEEFADFYVAPQTCEGIDYTERNCFMLTGAPNELVRTGIISKF
jgi:hypothetical protein